MHWMMVTSVLKLIFRKDPDFLLFSAQTWFPEQFSAAFLNSRLHCHLPPHPPHSLCLCLCLCSEGAILQSLSFSGFFVLLLCGSLQGLSFSGFIVAPPFFLAFWSHVWFGLQMWVDAGPCQAVYLGTRCDVFFLTPSFWFFTCFRTSNHFNRSQPCFLW
jgi:hypothetical protein